MRHRTLACVGAAVLGITMLWPAAADAQHRRGGRTVVRVARATRAVRVVRPVYSRGIYYSRYHSPYSFYWGWGYPWYPYPYFYGPYDPYWYGPYRPWWGYRYYDDYASVRVQASPREAQVYVDGYFVGVVDDFDGTFQRLRLPAGGHEITLHLTGYRNVVEKMYLQPSSTYRLRARLEPLPSGAPPEPVPIPNPDAARAIEEERGMYRREQEPPGPPSRRWPPRQQAEEQQAQRESRFGTLVIRVQPSDAEIHVDDTRWQGGADESGAISIQMPAGSHQIEVRRDGYASFVTQVEVRTGASTPLNVILQRED